MTIDFHEHIQVSQILNLGLFLLYVKKVGIFQHFILQIA